MSLDHTHSLENEFVKFSVGANNKWFLQDKRSGVVWGNEDPDSPWVLGLKASGEAMQEAVAGDGVYEDLQTDLQKRIPVGLRIKQNLQLIPMGLHSATKKHDSLECVFADKESMESVSIVFRLEDDALQVFLSPNQFNNFVSVEIFSKGLEGTDDQQAEVLAPVRMGLLLPADHEKPIDLFLDTYNYEGCHMTIAGMFKSGAVLMIGWNDPYIILHLTREINTKRRIRASIILSKTSRSFEIRCLGEGGLSEMAQVCRVRAEKLGYRVTWEQKRKVRPQVDRLFGAPDIKFGAALARKIDLDMREVSAEVRCTFDELAQIAEHYKNDLRLEKVLFHVGGWTRYGRDCRHPDVMPANPECGGNEALERCIKKVHELGYIFCLHDIYQDMYRDAPSWNEYYVQKEQNGDLHPGGKWLGGQAYITCSRAAMDLARRPQNLPEVRQHFPADLYFTDTTYAFSLQEFYDPRHPLTRSDDIQWKVELARYCREMFGMHGSECGREWGIPESDFFEGLSMVAGRPMHRDAMQPEVLGATVVPFFDMVFHDCVAIYPKYPWDLSKGAYQLIHHAAMGRCLIYRDLGDYLYWKNAPTEEMPVVEGPDEALYTRAHQGWAQGMCLQDRYLKNTHEILGPLNELTAEALIDGFEFLDAERRITKTLFSNGTSVIVNGSNQNFATNSTLGGEVILCPYGCLVQSNTFVAFAGLQWGGSLYDSPVLFTFRSLDGRPLSNCRSARIYHGFGDTNVVWLGKSIAVEREEVLVRVV